VDAETLAPIWRQVAAGALGVVSLGVLDFGAVVPGDLFPGVVAAVVARDEGVAHSCVVVVVVGALWWVSVVWLMVEQSRVRR